MRDCGTLSNFEPTAQRGSTRTLEPPPASPLMLLTADFGTQKLVSYDSKTFAKKYEVSYIGGPCRVRKLSNEFAVTPHNAPVPVATIHDETGRKLRQLGLVGLCDQIYGLEGVAALPGETVDRVIAGGYSKTPAGCNVLVFNSDTSKLIVKLRDAATYTFTIRCVPEWNHELFVGGGSRGRSRDYHLRVYDLPKGVLLNKLSGHRNGVWGVDRDVSKSIIFSVSCDRTAKLWSHDSLQCSSTLSLSNQALSCLNAEDLLIVGLSTGEVEVWDTRQTSGRINMFKPCSGYIYEMVRLDKDVFACGANEVTWWKPDGRIIKTIPCGSGAVLSGLCALGPATRLVRPLCLIPTEEMEFEEDEQFDVRCKFVAESSLAGNGFIIKTKGKSFRVAKHLLLRSVHYKQLFSRHAEYIIDDMLDIDPTLLRRVLQGDKTASIPVKDLGDYYTFFEKLGLRQEQYLICRLVETIDDLPTLHQSFVKCYARYEKSNLRDSRLESPICRLIFNKYKLVADLDQKHEEIYLFLRTCFLELYLRPDRCLPGEKDSLEVMSPFDGFPFYPSSFASLWHSHVSKCLFPGREHHSLELESGDGKRRQYVHADILAARCEYFCGLFRLCGVTSPLIVKELSADGLDCLVEYIYTDKLPDCDIDVQLHLLGFTGTHLMPRLEKMLLSSVKSHRVGKDGLSELIPRHCPLLRSDRIGGVLKEQWVSSGVASMKWLNREIAFAWMVRENEWQSEQIRVLTKQVSSLLSRVDELERREGE